MSEFKLTNIEETELHILLSPLSLNKRNSVILRIEQIIQARDVPLSTPTDTALAEDVPQIISARGESDGWVSVEDGLPDKEQQVSIVVTGNSACVGYIHERGHWIIQSLTSSYKENSLHNVTHWQPRPSPPKPDQQ
jgi:hypothetical protein